jgi:hypothetical protein
LHHHSDDHSDVRFVKERKVYFCLQTLRRSHVRRTISSPFPPTHRVHVLARAHVSPTLRTSSDALFQADSNEPDADLGCVASVQLSWEGEITFSSIKRRTTRFYRRQWVFETTIGSMSSLIGVRAVERRMQPHGQLQCFAGQINLRQNIHKKLLLIILKPFEGRLSWINS